MFSRTLVMRKYRDSAPLLDKIVVLIKGGFSDSGGSRNNPSLNFYDNTILQIDDVPEHLYIRILEEYNLKNNNDIIYTIKNNKDNYIDELVKEKEKLLKRLSEIDDILNNQ